MILEALKWHTTPLTIMSWLSVYMQVHSGSEFGHLTNFIYPQFTRGGVDFIRAAQLLDLCSLDVGIGNFDYSILAAAAISHILGNDVAMEVSGLVWGKLSACANWLEPYYLLLEEDAEVNPVKLLESSHIIQTYNVDYLECFRKIKGVVIIRT